MTMGEQVYLPAYMPGQDRVTVTGPEYHHLIRVRRFQENDTVWVVNGQGTAALTKIAQIYEAELQLEMLEVVSDRGEISKPVTLAVANLKGDHLDLVVEKATELGVTCIIPLLTDHTIKKGLNRERLERIAVAAMKQSRRSRLPVITELTPFRSVVRSTSMAMNLFCHAADTAVEIMALQEPIRAAREVVIWIGPEGDWSQDEIDLALISDYTSTGLGPRRLRAETAALHAVGLVSALL